MARTPRLFAAATRLGLRTPLFVSPINRIVSFLPREDWIIVGWVLAIKILLFLIAVKSHTMLWDEWVTSPYQWFQTWDQWDFGYYQEIAEFGYNKTDGSIAFYPLFPGLIRLVAYFSGNYLAAGLIVSGIACVVAAILLRRLVQLDYPVSVAMSSVWFFLIFPTAYFLHVGYTESLSGIGAGLRTGGPRRPLEVGWITRRVLLDDPGWRRYPRPGARNRSDATILGQAALELAMALNRHRADWFRSIFAD